MELKIDGQNCDLGESPIAIPGYDAASTESVDGAREGRSLKIEIPITKRNRSILRFAEDPDTAERFNDSLQRGPG